MSYADWIKLLRIVVIRVYVGKVYMPHTYYRTYVEGADTFPPGLPATHLVTITKSKTEFYKLILYYVRMSYPRITSVSGT